MQNSGLRRQVTVRQGAYLPHWTLAGATYHVVFRLADSLPAEVVARYRAERDALFAAAAKIQMKDSEVQSRLRELFSERIEAHLDAGHGACWLAQPGIASLVARALKHFDGTRYVLHAWCIMPNHVHAVAQPLPGTALPSVLQSWKGFTATEANRSLNRSGEFWQPEYYDHLIRDDIDLSRTIRYVQNNPVKAGLNDWHWVWPK